MENKNTQNKQFDFKKEICTIPNLLSLVRLCLIPVIVWLYCVRQDPIWTAVVLVLSGITDMVDGYIARHFNMVTDFGKAFDPVADKLTQLAMLLCLVYRFPVIAIPFVLLLVKEFTSGIMSLLVIRKTKEVKSADWHGKVCTALLYAMMVLHVLWFDIPTAVSYITVGICTGMLLLSFMMYGMRHIGDLKKAKSQPAQEEF